MFTDQLADITLTIGATAPDGSAAGGTPRCEPALATADEAAVSAGTVVVVPALFLFERQGDLNVFASVSNAAGWMEAIDVEDGERGYAFLHDGTVLDVASASGAVVLTPTEARDLPLLERLLADYRRVWASRPARWLHWTSQTNGCARTGSGAGPDVLSG